MLEVYCSLCILLYDSVCTNPNHHLNIMWVNHTCMSMSMTMSVCYSPLCLRGCHTGCTTGLWCVCVCVFMFMCVCVCVCDDCGSVSMSAHLHHILMQIGESFRSLDGAVHV